MARPREFDMTAALNGAMEIFWRQGYKATNLPELLAAMGLSRGSFYKAFADKESVYLEALDHYDATVLTNSVAALRSCDDDRASACLALMFAPSETADRGCFICNAMVELAPDNPMVAERTEAMASRLRAAIQGVLERSPAKGISDQNPETADMILHLYFGHQALGKSGGQRGDWQSRLARMLGEVRQAPNTQ